MNNEMSVVKDSKQFRIGFPKKLVEKLKIKPKEKFVFVIKNGKDILLRRQRR